MLFSHSNFIAQIVEKKEGPETSHRPTTACLELVPVYAALVVLLASSPVPAQTSAAVDFFRQNCTSCHTIGGGRLTGPDLKDVTKAKDRAWLVEFMQNPRAKIDASDAYALKLQQEARGVVMPTISGMTPPQANALLDMIEAESKLAKSQFSGSAISDRPFTAQDVAQGRAIFWGTRRLSSRGPACVSCHTFKNAGGLGGGGLGPVLTLVYERLQGRKGLGAWLLNPASPTMQPIFKKRPLQPEEIFALLALFDATAREGGTDQSSAPTNFFLLGLFGAVAGLLVLDTVFKRRFRGVRRALVHGQAAERGER